MKQMKRSLLTLSALTLLGLVVATTGTPLERIVQKETTPIVSRKIPSQQDLKAGTIKYQNENIHYITINPEHFKLELFLGNNGLTFEDVQKKNPLAFVNGSFFNEDFSPHGLLISSYKKLSNKIKKSNSGVFFIEDEKADIKYDRRFNESGDYQFAIQGYPVLIYNNQLQKISNDTRKTARTVLGIDQNSEIILASSEYSYLKGLTLTEMANLMHTDLNCEKAVNLDGGSSSQFYLRGRIESKGGKDKISNYILISKK